MSFENWDDVVSALGCALARLSDGEFLILGEPTTESRPRRTLFGRRTVPAATRYVQVLRIADVYTAECVGARSLGGTWQMSESTIEQLRSLGWRTPAESKWEFDNDTPNFDLYVALAAAPALSEVLLDSLRCLGARPEDLTLQTSQ